MAKIGIFYGSSTGRTEEAAHQIQKSLGHGDVINIAEADVPKINSYDVLILGTPTWGTGDLQDDWIDASKKLAVANLKGKYIAFFGLGDQESFPETFQDAMGILYEQLKTREVKFLGAWPTDGYYFEASKALVGGHFVGLALDNDTQESQTTARINRWTAALKEDFVKIFG